MTCAEGLELWGGAPTYPEWSGIRVCRSSCLLVIPVILALLVDHMDPVLGGLNARPLGVPVGNVWAYRDVPDDALAALSVVRRACRL
ncbi:hypothetical protein CRG98_017876 [Punica granatum]|uniref:Uncharacterized protein n=1 Tax=Punica granatum TaxID=22663 RepID=A0A2I0JZN9_PUNGR|nr:hypothetical protein CRG98_017876 [Punica granatum]